MQLNRGTNQPLRRQDDLPHQVISLLRHYARRRRYEPGLIEALGASTGDLAALAARGLVSQAAADDDPYRVFVRALPELWWLDLEAGVHALPKLADLLPEDTTARLRRDGLTLVSRLDTDERPEAWETAADLFTSLLDESDERPDIPERAVVLARGVALSVSLANDWLAESLHFVQRGPSRAVQYALIRDDLFGEQHRFIAALLLRGGSRSVALASAALTFAPESTLTRIRDLLSVAPPSALTRAAEAYGLLTLAGDEARPAADALRAALATQVWSGSDLTTLDVSSAFRGECLVADTVAELGDTGKPLARLASEGLVKHLGDGLADPGRRAALASCLAVVLRQDADYVAPFRLCEAKLRDMTRDHGARATGTALRGYAATLLDTCRALLDLPGGRRAADRLYARVRRIRRAHGDVLSRDLYPATLDEALGWKRSDEDSAWSSREVAWATAPGGSTPHNMEDPLPGPDEILATAEAFQPLPGPTAQWVGASSWSFGRLLGWMVPLPFRHLWSCALRWTGCGAHASLVLGKGGVGSVTVRERILGLTVRTKRRSLPGGRVWLFPEGVAQADRMLGNWSAVLILTSTLGAWLILGGAASTLPGLSPVLSPILGAGLASFGVLGYIGALALRKVLGSGHAVAVRDARDRVSVWRIGPTTRLILLEQQ
ncbi:MAG: hypothetical protein ACI9WU_005037 [Myxococcota bacterium]|jgi:hypothetical protein